MNLSPKARKNIETAIETLLGLAAGTPVALATTGTSQTVGAGAVVLAVSVAVTNLVQVPAVERFLDRVLGEGGETQLVSLAQEIQGVEAVLAEHVAGHADRSAPAACTSTGEGAHSPTSVVAAPSADATSSSIAAPGEGSGQSDPTASGSAPSAPLGS